MPDCGCHGQDCDITRLKGRGDKQLCPNCERGWQRICRIGYDWTWMGESDEERDERLAAGRPFVEPKPEPKPEDMRSFGDLSVDAYD